MLNCRDATKRISESLDKPLPVFARMELKLHLWMCRFCARFEKQMLFLRVIFKRYEKQTQAESDLPPDFPRLSPEAAERLKNALQEQKGS